MIPITYNKNKFNFIFEWLELNDFNQKKVKLGTDDKPKMFDPNINNLKIAKS